MFKIKHLTRLQTRSAPTIALLLAAAAAATPAAAASFVDPYVFSSGKTGQLDLLMIAAERPNVTIGPVTTNPWTYEICTRPASGDVCPSGTGHADIGGVRLALQPGDVLKIRLVNNLPPVTFSTAVHSADPMHPDLLGNPTNLHTHGLIVEPHRAVGASDTYGDYVFVELRNPNNLIPSNTPHPGVDIATHAVSYSYTIEATHPSGVYWFHPHLHGLSLNQVSAGLSGMITIGNVADTCSDQSCKDILNKSTVRHLILKDEQVLKSGVLKTQEEPAFCGGGGPANLGSCPGRFIDRTDPTTNYLGGTWTHPVSGLVYPDIDVLPQGDVWRILNSSGSRSYSLQLIDTAGNLLTGGSTLAKISMQLLSVDGITATELSASPALAATHLANKVVTIPCPNLPTSGGYVATCVSQINMMPSSRIEVRVARADSGTTKIGAILRTIKYPTGNGAGDLWPELGLASVTLEPLTAKPAVALNLKNTVAALISSTGQLGAAPLLQKPGTSVLVAATATGGALSPATGPAIQTFAQSGSVSVTPADLVGAVKVQSSCKPLAANHHRKILFGYPTPSTFGLGYVEVDDKGQDMPNTFIKIGAFDPAVAMVCVSVPATTPTSGPQTTVEEWEIVNLTDEDHNFHIHQTRFAVTDGGLAQGQTIDQKMAGIQVLHDNVPIVRGVPTDPKSAATCDGTVGNAACSPTSTFLLIPFRELGDFVFHCHILEHEDGGMMARIRVVAR